jgi:DNA processing protein
MLTEKNLLHSVALSLCSAKIQREFLKKSTFESIDDFIQNLNKEYFVTNGTISPVYGTDPVKASEKIISDCFHKGFVITAYGDGKYPSILSHIADPPLVLYSNRQIPEALRIAVVGTRKADPQGKLTARRLAQTLGDNGISIVSGMASGIDRAAHEGALDSNTSTVGVIAGGIDAVYPKSNSDIYLAMRQRENAVLISEMPPGVKVQKWSFVKRNRLISGISKGTVVVQASHKSGALITADFALEQNRDVFVCTAPPFSTGYEGCLKLANDGAVVVSDERTILDHLGLKSSSSPANYAFIENDTPIIKCLKQGIHDIDAIAENSGLGADELHRELSMLEIESEIIRSGNCIYLR